jgi:hypothetical protein
VSACARTHVCTCVHMSVCPLGSHLRVCVRGDATCGSCPCICTICARPIIDIRRLRKDFGGDLLPLSRLARLDWMSSYSMSSIVSR